MRKLRLRIIGQGADGIVRLLEKRLSETKSAWSFDPYVHFSTQTDLLIYEKFSMFQGSDMALIALVDKEKKDDIVLELISAGGKTGWLGLDLFNRESVYLSGLADLVKSICNKSWIVTRLE
jgi:hypothetical protein